MNHLLEFGWFVAIVLAAYLIGNLNGYSKGFDDGAIRRGDE